MTEALLNRAETLRDHASLLDLTHDGIVLRDMSGRILFWNRGAAEMYGWSNSEALEKVIHLLLATEFPKPLEQIEADVLENGCWEGELLHRKRDGTHIAVASRWALQSDSQGIPMGILEINRDITARKRAETKFRELLEAAPDAMAIVNQQGRIVLVNAQTEKLFGYTSEELLDQPVETLVPDRFRSAHQGHRTGYFTSPQARSMGAGLDLYGRKKDGTEFPVEISLSPLKTEEGILVTSAIRDVSERKLAQKLLERQKAELVRSNAELAVANKELEAFTYSVSHDLRAPLRHIGGFSQVLVEEFGSRMDPGAQHYLQQIQKAVHQMGQLVDDLLKLGRVGRQALREQPTELNLLVKAVLADLKPETEGRQIEWQIGQLSSVKCDPGLVKLVFVNLVSNAIKFTRHQEHAIIQVGQMILEHELVFFVRDNGVGFNMKYADQLFGIFRRLHRQEDFEGTGVGLANVQRIIHKHGGRVWAEAVPYKGAAFYFTLGISQEGGADNQTTLAGRAC